MPHPAVLPPARPAPSGRVVGELGRGLLLGVVGGRLAGLPRVPRRAATRS